MAVVHEDNRMLILKQLQQGTCVCLMYFVHCGVPWFGCSQKIMEHLGIKLGVTVHN